jgi:hypothetical protein
LRTTPLLAACVGARDARGQLIVLDSWKKRREVVLEVLCNDLPVCGKGHERGSTWGSWQSLVSETGDECVEIVEAILDARIKHVKKLAYWRDKSGRVMLDIATPLCRRAIQERLLFHKRYRLEDRPVHESSTSVVYFATDCEGAKCAAEERPIALKFMHSRESFEREKRARRALEGDEQEEARKYVLACWEYHECDEFAASVRAWESENGRELGRFCIVMPRADRSVCARAWVVPQYMSEHVTSCLYPNHR